MPCGRRRNILSGCGANGLNTLRAVAGWIQLHFMVAGVQQPRADLCFDASKPIDLCGSNLHPGPRTAPVGTDKMSHPKDAKTQSSDECLSLLDHSEGLGRDWCAVRDPRRETGLGGSFR